MIVDELRATVVSQDPGRWTRSMMVFVSELPVVCEIRHALHKLCYPRDPGTIPMELSTLTDLKQLDVGNNKLTGECLSVSNNDSTARTTRVRRLNEGVPCYDFRCDTFL